jgi:Na+/H+-dicarboxylate symporter
VGAEIGLTGNFKLFDGGNKTLGQTLLDIFPTNIFQAFSEGNMLGIILFSILLGFYITRTGHKNRELLISFFDAFAEVIMKITMFIIRFTPFGIFGIVARVVAEQAAMPGALANVSGSLGLYMLIVFSGILIHGLITLPIIMRLSAKVNPYKHLKNMSTVLLTAFSTSSSNATLPLTMSEVQQRDGVSEKISSFTLPLGATVNMNGTALYECVAVMFIAQAYGVELTFMQQAIVVLTALLAAIGSAGIPMAGIVMMSIILSAVGLPMEGIGLILVVDRPLDMARTALNVYGDTCAAAVIAKSEGETLKI